MWPWQSRGHARCEASTAVIGWLGAVPALLIAVALFTLPGLPVAWELRFRGLGLIAVSVAASAAIVGLAAISAPIVGMRWSLLPVLIVASGLALTALPLRWMLPAPPPSPARPGERRIGPLAVGGSLLLAAALIGQQLVRAIGDPSHPAQGYDAVFHLNAVRYILDTANASPASLTLGASARPDAFYPALWHAFAALVAQGSGSDAVTAANVTTLAVAVWVWPVAILFFAAPVLVRRPAHLLLASVLASVFTAFPLLMLASGALYPNVLSTALLPIALGTAHLALRRRARSARGADRVTGGPVPLAALWVAAGGALGAAVLAQPNALFGFSALILPLLVAVALDLRRSTPAAGRAWRWAGIATGLGGMVALWLTVSTHARVHYEGTVLRGLASALSNAPLVTPKAWFLTALVLGGAARLMLGPKPRSDRWLVGSYAGVVALFAAAMGADPAVRDLLTGGWYADAPRVAALLPVAAVPLAGVAAAALFDALVAEFAERRGLRAVAVCLTLAVLTLGARGGSMEAQGEWLAGLYAVKPQARMLSPDAFEMLRRLDRDVPPDALIAGDPWSGTAFAYAISERRVLFPRLNGRYGPEATELASHLRTLDRPAACALLTGLRVDYVLDFRGGSFARLRRQAAKHYAGLRNLRPSSVLTLVERQGDASLYRVNC